MNIPKPLYPCAHPECAQEVSYPAEMLRWSNGKLGWYCESCEWALDDVDRADWTLADELKHRTQQEACCNGAGGGCASPDCWMKNLRRRDRETSAGA